MQSLARILLVGLLATGVVAAPSIQKRSFTVERIKNPAFAGRNGPRALIKVYSKYSMSVSPQLMDVLMQQEAAAKAEEAKAQGDFRSKATGDGTVGTAPAPANLTAPGPGTGLVPATGVMMNAEYLSPVNIGGQTVNLDFDTGSSDLWVFNSQLPAATVKSRQIYDPKKSKNFKMMPGASWQIAYGDGSSASGNVGIDTVDVGGAVVKEQAVELATKVSKSFLEDPSAGLLGLAFSKINTVKPQKQKTFFENVMPSLQEPLFTADLRANSSGSYGFGFIDKTKYEGDMNWVPADTSKGFWMFSTSSFAVGTGGAQKMRTGQAIADTGTTLMLVSPEVTQAYYKQIPGAQDDSRIGGMTIPCDSKMPDLMVDIGGVFMAKVKGADIIFAKVSGNTCFGGIQPSPSGLQIWGDIFFRSQFIVFNGGNTSLGMAQHV